MEKKCLGCLKIKDLDQFNNSSNFRDGKRTRCRICQNEEGKLYRKLNSDSIRIKAKKYRKDNPEKNKEWVSNNRQRSNEIKKKYDLKNRNNEVYRMTKKVRNSIRSSFRNISFKKNNKTSEIIGCSMIEFINYIKSTFKEGMTIENHGEWHLDHIIPISKATTYEEAIKLNHYTNFQALWSIENLKKGNKYEHSH